MYITNFYLRGALTNNATAFRSRSWEYRSVRTIDLFESLNNLVEFNVRDNELIRVLPCTNFFNNNISKGWISDRLRYSISAFRLQRLDKPILLNLNPAKITTTAVISWKNFFKITSIFNSVVNTNVTPTNDALHLLKKLHTYLVFYNNTNLPDGLSSFFWLDHLYDFYSFNAFTTFKNNLFPILPQAYLFTSARQLFINNKNKLTAELNFKNYSHILITGAEIATISPSIWAQINYVSQKQNTKIYAFSNSKSTKFTTLTKNFKHIGDLTELKKFLDGRHWLNIELAQKNNRILLLCTNSVNSILPYINQLSYNTQGSGRFTIVPVSLTNTQIHSSLFGLPAISALDLSNNLQSSTSLLKNTTSILRETLSTFSFTKNKLISYYLSSHATPTVGIVSVVLPTTSFVENSAIFSNCLGELKRTNKVVSNIGLALSSNYVFLLLYASFLKRLDKVVVVYYLSSLFSIFKLQIHKFQILKQLINFGNNKQLNMVTVLIIFSQFIESFFSSKIIFNVVFRNQNFRVTQTNFWVLSKLMSSGYLLFNDEITLQSKFIYTRNV